MANDSVGGTGTDAGGFDIRGALNDFRASQPQTSQNPPVVPLWETRPAPARIVQRGGRDAADIAGVQGIAYGDAGPGQASRLQMYGKTSMQAEAAWMDMSDQDRIKFLVLARQAGLVGQKDVSPADLASAWSKAVSATESYNKQQTDASKWISPWEAVKKLAAQSAAGLGAYYDPNAVGSPQTTTARRVNKRTFTTNDIQSTAMQIAQDTLGRDPNPSELASYVAAVQRSYDANPEVNTTTTTTDAFGNSTATSELTGGVDPTPIIAEQAKNSPEHAKYQAGVTYFNAAMRALSSPV